MFEPQGSFMLSIILTAGPSTYRIGSTQIGLSYQPRTLFHYHGAELVVSTENRRVGCAEEFTDPLPLPTLEESVERA